MSPLDLIALTYDTWRCPFRSLMLDVSDAVYGVRTTDLAWTCGHAFMRL